VQFSHETPHTRLLAIRIGACQPRSDKRKAPCNTRLDETVTHTKSCILVVVKTCHTPVTLECNATASNSSHKCTGQAAKHHPRHDTTAHNQKHYHTPLRQALCTLQSPPPSTAAPSSPPNGHRRGQHQDTPASRPHTPSPNGNQQGQHHDTPALTRHTSGGLY
jgi:hypothetical protein